MTMKLTRHGCAASSRRLRWRMAAEAAAAQGGGTGHRRPVGGRARLRHAGARQGRGPRSAGTGLTKYTAVGGTQRAQGCDAREARARQRPTYERAEVMASCGGKHALYNAFQALFEEGDEVIVPAPYWVSYPDMVLLAGATPKIVETTPDARVPHERRAARGGVRAADRGRRAEQPKQPDGRGVLVGRATRDRTGGAPPRSDRVHRRHLRAPRRSGRSRTSARSCRSCAAARRGERRVEELRDDRLAHRLHGGAGGAHQGDDGVAEPEHVEPDVDRAGGGRRGAAGPPGVRARHGPGVPCST